MNEDKTTINKFTGTVNSHITSLTDILEENGLGAGRMVGGSKSGYQEEHPGELVIFNACIYDDTPTQVWWGDINLTESKKTLQKVANVSNKTFYVTYESQFRSDFNKVDKNKLERALTPEYEGGSPDAYKFEPNGDLK